VEIKDKKLKAYNTDAYGFIQNIKESSSIDLKGKNIVILGAGGATRAAIYGFKKEEVASITLVNRTESKARELADFFSDVQVQSWDKRENCLSNCDLLVNTTSLGMKNKAELEISLDNLPQKAAVYDIVYNPLKTKLLLEAEARGNEIIDGIGMLIHQAALAFSIWFGVMPESDKALKEKLLKLL
jgi:shikimate dehydrogenase